MKNQVAGFLLSVILVLASCVHEAPTPADSGSTGGTGGTGGTGSTGGSTPKPAASCSPDSVYFANDILPLMLSNCAMSGCHDAGSHKDGVILNSYTNVMKLVKAGTASSSKLYTIIVRTDGDRMPPPPAAPMTTDQINKIKTWINQGAKNNSCNRCDTTKFSYSAVIKPLLDNKCVGCHNANSKGGGVDLSNYTGVKASAANGGLYGSIAWLSGFSKMPQGGSKLPDCEIRQIKKWIDGGMQND